MDVIKELTADMLKKDVPEILIGSTVKVHVRIKEGEKERYRGLAASWMAQEKPLHPAKHHRIIAAPGFEGKGQSPRMEGFPGRGLKPRC